MRNKLVFFIIGILVSYASHGQRKSYLVDTFLVKGWVVVDEIDDKIWMVSDSFFTDNKQNGVKLRHKLKNEGMPILAPVNFEKFVSYDTAIRAMVEKIGLPAVMQKLHRRTNNNSALIYSKGNLSCYKVKANALLCMLLISSQLLPQKDQSDNAYTINYALLKVE